MSSILRRIANRKDAKLAYQMLRLDAVNVRWLTLSILNAVSSGAGQANYSYGLWFIPGELNRAQTLLGFQSFRLYIDSDNIIKVSRSSTVYSSAITIQTGQMYNVYTSYINANGPGLYKIYINGNLVFIISNGLYAAVTLTGSQFIGRDNGAATSLFNGWIGQLYGGANPGTPHVEMASGLVTFLWNDGRGANILKRSSFDVSIQDYIPLSQQTYNSSNRTFALSRSNRFSSCTLEGANTPSFRPIIGTLI